VAKGIADIKEVVAVRFLDDRDDAVQLDVAGRPVKDHGVLMLIGPLAQQPAPVALTVDVYRSETESSTYDLMITRSGDSAHPLTVTAVPGVAPS